MEKETGTNVTGPLKDTEIGKKRFADFDLAGNTFVVTGGSRGLGLALAEAIAEAGVYCLDWLQKPDQQWHRAQQRVVPKWCGSLEYRQVGVNNTEKLNKLIADVAAENSGIHRVIAAAGIQQPMPAIDYSAEDIDKLMKTNYTAASMTVQEVARMMFKCKCRGSIGFVASTSGSVANKGLLSSAYNSSKAALVQLARNWAMEWSAVKENNEGGIRGGIIPAS